MLFLLCIPAWIELTALLVFLLCIFTWIDLTALLQVAVFHRYKSIRSKVPLIRVWTDLIARFQVKVCHPCKLLHLQDATLMGTSSRKPQRLQLYSKYICSNICCCCCFLFFVCFFVSPFKYWFLPVFGTVEWKGSVFVRSTSDKVGLASECEPWLPAVASLTGWEAVTTSISPYFKVTVHVVHQVFIQDFELGRGETGL